MTNQSRKKTQPMGGVTTPHRQSGKDPQLALPQETEEGGNDVDPVEPSEKDNQTPPGPPYSIELGGR